MASPSPSGLHDVPDAATTARLRQPHPAGRFAPPLEAEYVLSRLRHDRTLVRMACLLTLALSGLRIGASGLTGDILRATWGPIALVFPAVILGVSVAMTALAWSGAYERLYLPLANYLVPLRNAAMGIAIGAVSATSQLELLTVVPAMVLSPFFFLGLHFRPALIAVAITIITFTASAAGFGMPTDVLLRVCALLLLTAATSAVASWHIDKQSRRSFLDSRLIAELAEQDPLTGAKNRRVFDGHLARVWQQALRDDRPIALLLIDVDYFKPFNDRYGHQAGDRALQGVARAVQAQVARPLDLLARFGGEEFAVVLYDIDARSTLQIAERIRQAVGDLGIAHDESPRGHVTVSIGVAAMRPVRGRTPGGAVQLADEALYAAKMQGRDRVHLAGEADYGRLQTGVFAQPLRERAAGIR